MNKIFSRRQFLAGTASASLALGAGTLLNGCGVLVKSGDADRVPNSSGTERPRMNVPANACDAHIHIADPRFAAVNANAPISAGMTVDDYRKLQARNGTVRTVVIQPKVYGTNNDCTLDAVKQLGSQGRGIAVLHPDVTDAELQRLHAGGIRGIRFSVWNPDNAVASIDMIEPLAVRISELGWHVQLHMSGDQIVDNQALIGRLPAPVVFDHMGRLPPSQGTAHPAFAVIAKLIERDKAWVKLAGAYLNTEIGPPAYADSTRVAKAWVDVAPERLVWGSDWPHVTEKTEKPDDAQLLDLLLAWAPDEAVRKGILVDNPARLYQF
ncbi:amidohydrolase family protein [Pseudomonas matsuisoli]|uniref:2-pyrone-4,6-dicarboxylate hydrolase n=1 Tax=Pseudomonas matsuisoli TaxID=1515666 RepID=A0A917UVL9_9PSED|nr:amidohydrolase family protein [Pseudomonas matsuisoli]GGJ87987.1 2-pyrone-4,6-dicarboxylate hydrolase [Pseudomonas matsuisoli]